MKDLTTVRHTNLYSCVRVLELAHDDIIVGWQRLEELKRNHEMEMAEVLRKSRYENGEKLEAMQRGYDKQVHELNVSAR